MHSYGRLSRNAKIALVLCWPDGVDLHVNPDHVDAQKIDKALRNFEKSADRCSKLGECLDRALTIAEE